jgi:hypothetical protein
LLRFINSNLPSSPITQTERGNWIKDSSGVLQ